jgi:succinate-acetate transporter protein
MTPSHDIATDIATVPTRIVLRPLATPLPLGFLGLFAATLSFSALQLGWVAETEGATVALGILVLTVPVQLVASVMGFLARDPVAATGMGVLAGTWAAITLATLTSPPGAASAGLGVILLASAAAMLVPAVAGHAKVVASSVMVLSAARFAVTGIAELSGDEAWMTAAGWTGLVLAALSLYAALAFELEGTAKHGVIPLLRRGKAAAAVDTSTHPLHVTDEPAREPGVREQL